MKQPILLMVPIYTSYTYFPWNIEFLRSSHKHRAGIEGLKLFILDLEKILYVKQMSPFAQTWRWEKLLLKNLPSSRGSEDFETPPTCKVWIINI